MLMQHQKLRIYLIIAAIGMLCVGIKLTAAEPGGKEDAGPGEKEPFLTGQEDSRCNAYTKIDAATGVTFVVTALFGGLICNHVLSFLPIPYTALLLVHLRLPLLQPSWFSFA